MSRYIAAGLLGYWAGRKHRMLRRKLCRNSIRKEARRLFRMI